MARHLFEQKVFAPRFMCAVGRAEVLPQWAHWTCVSFRRSTGFVRPAFDVLTIAAAHVGPHVTLTRA